MIFYPVSVERANPQYAALFQKQLGYENYETTVDIYTHFTKDDISEMLNQINAI